MKLCSLNPDTHEGFLYDLLRQGDISKLDFLKGLVGVNYPLLHDLLNTWPLLDSEKQVILDHENSI